MEGNSRTMLSENLNSPEAPEQRTMEQRVVSSLERRIEKAIAEVIMQMGLKRLPLLPSQQTMHLMAKAAVGVYEAAAESSGERQ